MKIFGIEFTTKKELKAKVSKLESELEYMQEAFPFDLGQTVYDVAFKDDKGRYTKTKPSLEHSIITTIVVDEKNYFSLVNRFRRKDVFMSRDAAETFLRFICK